VLEASAGAVTWTLIVHVPGLLTLPAGIVPPVNETVRGKEVEAVPPQVVVAVPGTTVKTVPGKVSVIFTPVYTEPVGFCSEIITVVLPPAWNDGGEKLFSMFTVCTLKTSDVGEIFVSPCCVIRAFAGIVFT